MNKLDENVFSSLNRLHTTKAASFSATCCFRSRFERFWEAERRRAHVNNLQLLLHNPRTHSYDELRWACMSRIR